MTNEDAIKLIECVRAEVEWNYPLDYAVAFDKAIEALKRESKCNTEYTVYLGEYEVDPCVYEEIERHENVTVIVNKCKNCGHIDISWEKENDQS